MEGRALDPRVDGIMEFTVLHSSAGRNWRGFEATLYEATGGYSESCNAHHSISMHLGEPALVMARCDGRVVNRIQRRGDIRIIPARYSGVWQAAASTRNLVVDMSNAFVRKITESLGLDPDRTSIRPQLQVSDKRIEHICWALAAELEGDAPAGRLYAESLGTALITHLVHSYTGGAPTSESGIPRMRLQRVMDYVQDNISVDLSLSELSAVAEVSGSYLKVIFKRSTGVPVHQYVMRVRIERALTLVTRTKVPLCEIAAQCGFTDQSHLTRSFRRLYGITPAQLRR